MQIYSPWKGCTNLPVIDLHSHLVPCVDDGVQQHSEALSILGRMELEYGSGSMVAFTPHFTSYMPSRVTAGRTDSVIRFMEGLEERFRLDYISAGELLVRGFSLENLERVRYPGTGYVLVEFNSGVTWVETLFHLRRITSRGYRPLLAHPERYRWCRGKPDRLIKLSLLGCGTLASARSLRYPMYAGTVRLLLEKGLVHAIASDVHSASDPILSAELKSELKDLSRVPWEDLTYHLPSIILDDAVLPTLPLSGRQVGA